MKRYYYIILLPIIIFTTSCTQRQDENEAIAYFNVAKEHYINKENGIADEILDSLPIKYPLAYKTKSMAIRLKESIKKDESINKIDSISDKINKSKIEIIHLRQTNPNHPQIQVLELKMDSLENLKQPFRNIYDEIRTKEVEFAARTQCITRMQSINRSNK